MTRQIATHIRHKTMTTHTGRCFCGAVEIEVTGAAEAMGYCHCDSCRSWSAAPVNAFTLWKPENVKVEGRRVRRALHEDREKRPAVLHEVRWTPDDQPSALGLGRCLCGCYSDRAIHPRCPRQLRRDGAANEGWSSEIEGLPG